MMCRVMMLVAVVGMACKGTRSTAKQEPAAESGSASEPTPEPEIGPPPENWDAVWERALDSRSPTEVTEFPAEMRALNEPQLEPAKPGPTVIPAQLAELVNLERLSLSSLGLARVPTAILGLRKLTKLSLRGNQITEATPLSAITSLVELDLRWNQIADAATLAALPRLSVLYLEKNGLTTVPAELAKLPLRKLVLSYNQLTSCPTQLPATLEELDLSYNEITEVPAALVAHPSLKLLQLSGNKGLRTLPLEALAARTSPLELGLADVPLQDDVIVQLLALRDQEKVTFSHSIIPDPGTLAEALAHPTFATSIAIEKADLVRGKLPDSLWTLANLTELDLRGLGLADLPPGLAKLEKLRTLRLGRNRLSRVPDSVLSLTALETLELDENQLTTLPAELAKLANLKTLDLFGNQLAEVPAVLLELEHLEHLDLDGNPLEAIPDSLRARPNLRRLYGPIALEEKSSEKRWCNACAGADNEDTPEDCFLLGASDGSHPYSPSVNFSEFRNVRVLILTGLCAGPGYPAKVIPDDVSACVHLRVLNASRGKISTLPESIGELRRLAKLDLSNNRLRTLPSAVLKLPYLEELDLRNNKLRSLPRGLAKLPRLRRLYVDGNPIPPAALKPFEKLISPEGAGTEAAGSAAAQ